MTNIEDCKLQNGPIIVDGKCQNAYDPDPPVPDHGQGTPVYLLPVAVNNEGDGRCKHSVCGHHVDYVVPDQGGNKL